MTDMSAYVIFTREGAIRDESAMEIYSRMNRESPPDPKLTPLVVYGAVAYRKKGADYRAFIVEGL